MSVDNPLWGAPRIHGDLSKLGFEVGQTTTSHYELLHSESVTPVTRHTDIFLSIFWLVQEEFNRGGVDCARVVGSGMQRSTLPQPTLRCARAQRRAL